MSFQNSSRFQISQHFTVLVNRFDLYDDKNELIGFSEQKRFDLREKVTIWESGAKDRILFTIVAEKVFDVHGKYFVADAEGRMIGYLRKEFVRSLIRSTWGAYDPQDKLLYEAIEQNVIIALIRRVGSFVDFIGILLEQLPFGFTLKKEGKVVGYHRRLRGIRDRYELAVEGEAETADKRILLALGLLLDILQQR